MPRRSVWLSLAALAALALAGCKRPEATPGRDRPLVLVFGPQHAPRELPLLAKSLEAATGLSLDLRTTHTADEAIDLVQSKRADAALTSLFDFLFCAELYHAEPLLQVLRKEGRAEQKGELAVKLGSAIRDLKGLEGARVGYVDRFSVTGFLLPAAQLRAAGVKVVPVWLDSHEAVLAAVREGRVEVGASWAGHAVAVGGLTVLASTGAVPNEPVFVQPRLGAEQRAALSRGLLALEPAALEGVADATGFRAVPAGAYQAALETLKIAGREVEDVVQGGWTRANDDRRPLWSFGP